MSIKKAGQYIIPITLHAQDYKTIEKKRELWPEGIGGDRTRSVSPLGMIQSSDTLYLMVIVFTPKCNGVKILRLYVKMKNYESLYSLKITIF